MAIAVVAPVLLNLKPSLRMPSAVAEIVLGVALGPSGLGWIHIDQPISILALLGLALLLFLAGLEIDTRRLRHGLARLGASYAASVALAVLVALGIAEIEDLDSPLFVGFTLASSTLGLIVPILRDAGETETEFGQTVLAGASVGEFGAILLLSLFFSKQASSTGSRLFLLALFAAFVAIAAVALSGLGRSVRVSTILERLEDTSAQLGVRIAVAVLIGFAALASALGLETILGVFVAGVVLRMVDSDARLIHSEFRSKIEAIGYGFLVPVFFIASGLQLDFRDLFLQPRHLALVPIFLLGLLIARGLPALAYRRQLGARRAAALGLLQAASLTVIVIAANLGHQLHIFDDPTDAALVVAGVLSVIVFPSSALLVLGSASGRVGEVRRSSDAGRQPVRPDP
jgi:Kef-type K+ transport system membrane component KefB